MSQPNKAEALEALLEKDKKYGLPEGTLAKIWKIESGNGSGSMVSSKGAMGHFQFIKSTGAQYGLKETADFYDFDKSSEAAGKYLRDNLKLYKGDINKALAQYNGGFGAVEALKDGKPWKETADYLNKFHGMQTASAAPAPVEPPPLVYNAARHSSASTSAVPSIDGAIEVRPLSPEAAPAAPEPYKKNALIDGFEPQPLTIAPNASALAQQKEQDSAKYDGVWNTLKGTAKAAGVAFQRENSVYNFILEQGMRDHTDPDFEWNKERTDTYLKNIPTDYHGYVLQAKSDREAKLRQDRLDELIKKTNEVGRYGLTANLVGGLIGSLPDLPTLVAFVPGMGAAGLMSRTSRIANAVTSGLAGAAVNVGIDAATAPWRPMATHQDLYYSAALGLALGGLGGAATNPLSVKSLLAAENAELSRTAMKYANDVQVRELEQAGYKLTPEGVAHFKPSSLPSVADATKDIIAKIRSESQMIINRDYPLSKGDPRDLYVPVNAPGRDPSVASLVPPSVEPKVEPKLGSPETKVTPEGVPKVDFKSGSVGTVPTTAGGKPRPTESAHAILDNLAGSGGKLQRTLATRLKEQLPQDFNVFTVSKTDMEKVAGKRTLAYYDPAQHAVYIQKDTTGSVQLHEFAHAATSIKMHFARLNPDTAHGQLYKELTDLFDVAVAEGSKRGMNKNYYLSNVDEFVAGLYGGAGDGHTQFLQMMRDVKVAGDKTLFTKFVDTVRKLLGMDANETNLLLKSLGVVERIGDERLDVTIHNVRDASLSLDIKLQVDPVEFKAAHSGVAAEDVQAANAAGIPEVYGWGLGLENRLGGKNSRKGVRDLASRLFGTTIGYKDHSVVKANAWDDTTQLSRSWTTTMRKDAYPAFEDWFKQNGYKWHEKGAAFEDFGQQVSNYIRGFEGDYAPQVQKAGNAMRKVLDDVREHINNPLYRDGGVKRGLTETIIKDENGVESVVGKLEANPFYLPRKHDPLKWNAMVERHGREAVEGWWARAYQAGREGVSDEQAAKWAKWYVDTVDEAHSNRSGDLLEDMMRGQDKEALKDSLIRNGGFDEAEAWRIIDDMFPNARAAGQDSGRLSSSLKHRNTIKETYTEALVGADGQRVEISLNDFTHSNAFDVVEPYLRRMAGNVALAKHLDIYKVGDIDAAIEKATRNNFGAGKVTDSKLKQERELLKLAFDEIQGVPREDFTGLRKGLEMWRSFNVIRLMGGAAWNQAAELSQIAGTMGWKATMEAVSELKALKRDIETGKAPHDYLEHLENTIGGVGAEFVERMSFKSADDWVRNNGDSALNRGLDKLDNGLKKMAKGVLDYTGMTPLMIQQKRIHAIALTNHFVNKANGKAVREFLTPERLAVMGMSEADLKGVLKGIKDFSSPKKGEFSNTFSLDFAGFQKAHPELHAKLVTAINRESRRVVQEADLASMVPLMGTTLGQTVFQFMNFSIQGWNKSLMYAMNHRDWATYSTMMWGGTMASLAYMGRTMAQSSGMDAAKQQEFLAKRMDTKQIVANSFGRIAQVSLLPQIYDSTLGNFTGAMFSGMRTTSDLSSLASNPTLQGINSVLSMGKIVRNSLSDETQTTAQDVRSWAKLAPLNNIYPMTHFFNRLANDFPTTDKE